MPNDSHGRVKSCLWSDRRIRSDLLRQGRIVCHQGHRQHENNQLSEARAPQGAGVKDPCQERKQENQERKEVLASTV